METPIINLVVPAGHHSYDIPGASMDCCGPQAWFSKVEPVFTQVDPVSTTGELKDYIRDPLLLIPPYPICILFMKATLR